MRTQFIIRMPSSVRIAIADLVKIDRVYWITRINVPAEFRGQGYGSKLLTMICNEADLAGETLLLQIQPSGGLSGRALAAWYHRYGFQVQHGGGLVLARTPRILTGLEPEPEKAQFKALAQATWTRPKKPR